MGDREWAALGEYRTIVLYWFCVEPQCLELWSYESLDAETTDFS